MANPWTKKNSALSLVLSGANAWAGAARGVLTKEARRQRSAATSAGVKQQVANFWTAALEPPTPGNKKRKRRR